MANLYIGPITLKKLNQTFYDALVSDIHCAIVGVSILKKGTPEWKEYLARRRHALEGIHSTEELDGIMTRLDVAEQHYEPTELFAVNFDYRFEHPDRYVPKRVIFDKSYGIVAEVSAERRQIDVFRDSGGFGDLKDPKIVECHFVYDGNLQDALQEFEQRGYQFNLWDERWYIENLENAEKTRRIANVVPVESVTLEDVLRFACQTR